MLVIDVTDLNSFSSLDSWHAQFVKLAKPKCPDKLPLVVMGNKVDQTRASTGNETLRGDKQSAAPISRDEVIRWCRSKTTNFCYIETSAATGEGVEEAFRTAAVRGLA